MQECEFASFDCFNFTALVQFIVISVQFLSFCRQQYHSSTQILDNALKFQLNPGTTASYSKDEMFKVIKTDIYTFFLLIYILTATLEVM